MKQKTKKKTKQDSRFLPVLLAVFAILGIVLLSSLMAAGHDSVALQAEKSSLSNTAARNNSTASGKSFVELNRLGTGPSYYVSPNGSGVSQNRNQPGNQKATLDAICGQIKPPSTIVFLIGVYSGATSQGFTIRDRNCGGPNRYIRLKSESKHGAKVKDGNGIRLLCSSYFTVEDFERFGRNMNDELSKFEYGIITRLDRNLCSGDTIPHHIIIRGNYVHNVGSTGIGSTEGSHTIVEDNLIHNTASWDPSQGSAISLGFSRDPGTGSYQGEGPYSNIVRNNRAYDHRNQVVDKHGRITDGNCIIIDANDLYGRYSPRTLIANNVCYNNARGVNILTSSHVDVFNNTLFRNQRHAKDWPEILLLCESRGRRMSDIKIFNNTIVPTQDSPALQTRYLVGDCDNRNIEVKNNVIAGSFESNGVQLPTSSNLGDLGNCSANIVSLTESQLLFVAPNISPNGADFNLQFRSPLINRGCPSVPAEATTALGDYDGQPRLNAQIDVGAHEFH